MSLEERAEVLRNKTPHLIADVWLYPTDAGGKNIPALPGWGCPCVPVKTIPEGWDGWPILDEPLAPGERRRVGFFFLSGELAADVLRSAGTFYLWEGRIIGEAVVIP